MYGAGLLFSVTVLLLRNYPTLMLIPLKSYTERSAKQVGTALLKRFVSQLSGTVLTWFRPKISETRNDTTQASEECMSSITTTAPEYVLFALSNEPDEDDFMMLSKL